MIKRNLNIMYLMTLGLMSMLVLFLTTTTASAGGSGHTHEEEGVHGLEIPKKYQDKKNPFWSDIDALVAGSKIYKENCAKCHGTNGKGDGPLAKSMSTKPFSFQDSKHMSQMNDGYLYWRTVEGGKHPPFRSKMPAYKNVLTEEEVWQVLAYAHAFSHRHFLAHTHVAGEDVAMAEKRHREEERREKEHGH
jgi:mono/diheme cytochrome c family protein